MKKINKTKLYYLTLITILTFKIIATVFQAGLNTHYGTKLARLQLQKNNLSKVKLELITEVANKKSLTKLAQTQDFSQYINISNTIQLSGNNTVALR